MSTFSRNALKLMSGTAIVQAINLAAQPIVTRIYSPTDFGIMTVLVSSIAIANIVGFCAYDKSIPILKEDENHYSVVKTLLTCLGVLFTICMLFLFLFAYCFGDKGFVVFVGAILIFFALLDNIFTNLNYKLKQYSLVAKRKVIVAVLLIFTQIMFGKMGFGIKGLLVAYFISSFIGVLVIALGHLKKIINVTFVDKQFFIDYKRLPLIETPTNLMNTASIQLPVYFIAHYLSMSLAGQYGLALKVVGIPFALIAGSLADVFTQNFAKLYNEKKDYYSFTINVWKKIFLLGLIPTLILLIMGPQLFTFVFGKKWLLAGQISQLLIISSFISMFSAATLFAFMIINKSKYIVFYTTIISFCRVMSISVLYNNFWLGLTIFVLSEACVRIIWLLLLNNLLKNLSGDLLESC